MAKLKRWTKNRAKDLVTRARLASGNDKFGLSRMPKGHWMRKDQAKIVRRNRVNAVGKVIRPGIKANY